MNYIEDDIEFPILTSNAVITGQNISLSDESPETKKDIQKYFRTQHAAVQDLYPFELRCDIKRSIDSQTNNVEEPTDTK